MENSSQRGSSEAERRYFHPCLSDFMVLHTYRAVSYTHLDVYKRQLLTYRLGESQLAKIASPFLLDGAEQGGLGLSTASVGVIYGTRCV